MNRRIETALRSKYNFRKQCSNEKETNELFAQGYCFIVFLDIAITLLRGTDCCKQCNVLQWASKRMQKNIFRERKTKDTLNLRL